MKSAIMAYFIIPLLLLLSCSEKTGNRFVGFEMFSDAAVEGAPIKFRFALDDADRQLYENQQLYAEIALSPSNDGARQRDTVIRLSPGLEGELIVPRNTAAVKIDISTKETILKYSSGFFIVYNKKHQPVRKARTYQLWYYHLMPPYKYDEKEKKSVDSLFRSERACYPDEVSIFFCRWLYESGTGLLDTAILQKDLAILSKYRGSATGDAMLAVGSLFHTLAKKQAEIVSGDTNNSASIQQTFETYRLPDAIIGRANNPVFNDPWFVNWLFAIRGSCYIMTSEWNDEKQSIIRANPVSWITTSLFRSGVYKDISPETALFAAEELIAQSGNPLYKYYKMRILNQFYPARRAECFALVQELKAVVRKDTYYEESLDPNHTFYGYRIEPYLVEGELLARSGLYDSALAVFLDARKMIDNPWDITHAMVLTQCSECLQKKGRIDSSTKYLAAAARLAPGQQFIQDTLHARYSNANTKLDFNSWMRAIEKTLPDETYAPVPKSMENVSLSNGTTLDFKHSGDTIVVLECWSAGCSLCTKNLMDAYTYLKQNHSGKVKVIVATQDARALDEQMKKMKINLPVLRDNGTIIRTLRIGTYPTTIVIRRGLVVGRYTGLQNIGSIVDISR